MMETTHEYPVVRLSGLLPFAPTPDGYQALIKYLQVVGQKTPLVVEHVFRDGRLAREVRWGHNYVCWDTNDTLFGLPGRVELLPPRVAGSAFVLLTSPTAGHIFSATSKFTPDDPTRVAEVRTSYSKDGMVLEVVYLNSKATLEDRQTIPHNAPVLYSLTTGRFYPVWRGVQCVPVDCPEESFLCPPPR